MTLPAIISIDTPRWLQRYLSRNFQLVFYPEGQKGPTEKEWQNRTFTAADYRDGMNVGVKTGIEIDIGKFLHDIDFDWTDGIVMADRLLPYGGFAFGRKSKPLSHIFITASQPYTTIQYKDPTDQTVLVELRGAKDDGSIGFQTMVPPSRHPSDEVIEFVSDGDLMHVTSPDIVVRNYAIACLLLRHLGPRGFLHDHRLALAGFLLNAKLSEDEVVAIACALAEATGNNVVDAEGTVRTTAQKLAAGDKRVKGARALADALGENGKRIVAKIREWIGSDGFARRVTGEIIAKSQHNVRVAFERLGVEMTFDAFANKPYIKYDGHHGVLSDAVRNRVWLSIDQEFGFLPPQQFFDVVIQDTAWQNKFHPVREYLNGLKWDGVERIDRWLSTYGRAVLNEYTMAVGALVLIAAVRRVRRPGCKFDEMLVLESSTQGLQKSTAIRELCPNPHWFSDDLPLHIDAKQVIERTAGKWIIEAADLSGMSKTRVESLKAFLSRGVDGPVRMAYAHVPDEVPRQFIIVGTTNNQKYLRDTTGNRRFWPVKVELFHVDGITRDRDQLWAEAAHREAQGVSIRLDPRLYPLAAQQQENRRLEDPWESTLSKHFDDKKEYRLTTDDVFELLNVPPAQRNHGGAERVVAIMESLGFEHKKARAINNADGKTIKRWCRGPVQGELDVE